MVADDGQNHLLETRRLTDADVARRTERSHAGSAPLMLLIYHRDGVQALPLAESCAVVLGRCAPAGVAIRDSSLSRQHASVQLIDGQVWVEDLGSTNGTWVNGRKVDRCQVTVGDELTFGAVPASLHMPDPFRPALFGLEGHDRFLLALQREVARARTLGRSLSLVMLRSETNLDIPVSRWFPRLQQASQPFDQMALYSADTVELLLPELGAKQAGERIAPVAQHAPGLRCGVASCPEHATSADALIEAARKALLDATATEPVWAAPPTSAEALPDVDSGEPVIESEAMRKVFSTVQRLGASAIPVLLVGETGTGKEVVARTIHERGPRAGRPLICTNCGGIPDQLVESTLFGHEQGAFTGATQRTKGVFESAHGGTVFFDEVGELPLPAQAALLRVLENQRFCRVGSTSEIEVDIRILAATHRDLEALSAQGGFREDLLYRLNAMTLRIPPLRERPEEIVPLVHRFIQQANRANGCATESIDEQAMRLLLAYPWPGNVRELRNAILRAVVIAEHNRITPDDLPDRVRSPGALHRAGEPTSSEVCDDDTEEEIDLKTQVNRFEARLIRKVLVECGWDRSRAAQCLGVPLRTLSYKMQTHGIRRDG